MNEFTKAGIQKKRQSLFNRKTQTVEYAGSTHTHTHTHTHTADVVGIAGQFPDPPDGKIQVLKGLSLLDTGIASPSHNFSLGSSPPTYH